MDRRQFMMMHALLAAAPSAYSFTASAGPEDTLYAEAARKYLAALVPSRKEVTDWLQERAFPFGKYDSDLGYLHRNRRFKEGVQGTYCTYTYDESGARHTIMYRDKPCRINTYGNSFTSCEQVNDGQTWQETLAAQLEEPVRNYGIGGYSVYMSYLRMIREEMRNPAPYVVFNIFDDDHYRNLISWQRITNGMNWKHFHPTLPYIKANPSTGSFVEVKNLCPTPDSVYNLCSLDWVYKTFKDDFVLRLRLVAGNSKDDRSESAEILRQLAAEYGNAVNYSGDDLKKNVNTLYTQTAIFASTKIIEMVENFASTSEKKVLYVLSYGPANVSQSLQGEPRFDQSFIDFLESRKLPYVDMLETHARDYSTFKIPVNDYIKRYYIGHYSPVGNSFCGWAIMEKLVGILEPKPDAYRATG
jgi:hypothetical protein